MNYRKHYDLLISRAQSRIINGYSEKHHIIPRCMGGADEPENIVCLTAEEHYLAHQLLVKMYPKHKGIVMAANIMGTSMNEGRLSNKQFGWIRRRMANVMTGRTLSEETRKKMSDAAKGKKLSEETKRKISEYQRGKTVSEDTREKMKRSFKGRNAKTYHLIDPNGEKITVTNVAQFCRDTGIPEHAMRHLLRGETKTCKGWSLQ